MKEKLIVVDENTGEKIGDYKKKARKKSHSYFLILHENVSKANITIHPVMAAVLGEMNNKNLIVFNSVIQKNICDRLGVTINSLYITLSRMCKLNLLIRIASSVYFANPYYATKSNVYQLEGLQRSYSELLFTQKQKKDSKKPQNSEVSVNIIKMTS